MIDLDDRLSGPMARAAASTAMFRRELDSSSGSVIAFDKTTKDTSPSIDRLSGRLAIMGRAVAALGPSLVPITTAMVPAVAGLANQLGFAAAGAGTAVLAFKGVGDALGALNEFQLSPTQANFEKLEEKLRGLGPSAQAFVLYLDEIGPKLQKIREAAQDGLLPGATEGIDALLTRLPEVRRIVSEVANVTGETLAGMGSSLASGRWDEFFTFLESEARPALTTLAETAGNVAGAMAELWMAMDPLSDDFASGLVRASESFEQWAAGLDQTEGFQDFLAYIRETGPQVLDTIGSLANMLIDIGTAAAPLGGPILTGIEAFAKAISVIAESDLGTPIFGAVAAMSALSLATKGWASVMDGGAVGKVRGLTADLKTMGNEGVVAWGRSAESAKRYADASERVKRSLGGFGKTAALVGGVALATSDLGDKMNLSNTASMALMGTFLGPWGAAVGGAVGLTMDLVSVNDDLAASYDRARASADAQRIDLTQQNIDLQAHKKNAEDYAASVERAGSIGSKSFGDMWARLSDIVTNETEEQKQKTRDLTEEFLAVRQGLGTVFADLNNGDMSLLQGTDEELTAFANQIAPAAARAGLDLREALLNGDWGAIANAVRDYTIAADSAKGRSQAVGEAMAALAGQVESTVTQAEALKNALDMLFGPGLNQSAATDAWTASLRDLNRQIAETNGQILGNSQAALENRSAIRDSVQSLNDKVAADAAAGVSGDKLVKTLQNGARAIEDQAVAAGANRKHIQGYLNDLGMTPKNIRTIIETPGLLTAKQQVQALGQLYGLTPKQIKTLIEQPGMGKSTSDIRALLKQYGATPKQVETLIKLLGADGAIGKVSSLRGIYASLPREIVTNIVTNHIDKFTRATGGEPKVATGGYITGPGTGTSDSIPAWLSNGEYVIKAAAVAKYGTHMFDRLNAMHFARGGPVRRDQPREGRDRLPRDPEDRAEILRLLAEIRDLRADLAATGKDALTGLDRKKTEAELQATLRDLREKRGEKAREAREARQQRRETVRNALGAFDLVADEQTPGDEIREQFKSLNAALKEAKVKVPEAFDEMRKRAVKLADRIGNATERLEKRQQKLDDLIAERESFESSVRGTFNANPWGNGLSGAMLQLEADANDANARNALLQQAIGMGFDGEAFKSLAASGDLNTLQQLVAGGPSAIAALEAAFNARAAAQNTGAGLAGEVAFGALQRELEAKVGRIEASIERMTQKQERLQDKLVGQVEAATKRGTREGAEKGTREGMKDTAKGASQRGRNRR